MMNLPFEVENYLTLKSTWPDSGNHILYSSKSKDQIIVYQAFNSEIASYAVQHQTFKNCPQYKETRMTWIKTNFLWMMYRCGWGKKDQNQSRILAITITTAGFEEILRRAKRQGNELDGVRLQWDPDHDPFGEKVARRAIQLGLKGDVLQLFINNWIVKIDDITGFVEEQRKFVERNELKLLQIPKEIVYSPNDKKLIEHLQLSEV